MAKQFEVQREKTHISQGIITGAFIGAIAGALVGLLVDIRVWSIPGISSLLVAIPLNEIISGVLLGIFAGGIIGSLIGLYNLENKMTPYDPYIKTPREPERIIDASDTSATIQLREERLDIAKSMVKSGEVNIHKEVHSEEKNITVPVTREELVIEKTTFEDNTPNSTEPNTETIRIPLREERIKVTKEPVILEDVQVHRNRHEENKHIEEILRREQLSIKTKGTVKVRNKYEKKH